MSDVGALRWLTADIEPSSTRPIVATAATFEHGGLLDVATAAALAAALAAAAAAATVAPGSWTA